MGSDEERGGSDEKQKVTVEASTVEGLFSALGVEPAEPDEPGDRPAALSDVDETVVDIYEGVEMATEEDSRGRSRKMVRGYADREDLSSDQVGHVLRVLEGHDLVVQDGNRWRVADEE